MVDLFLSTYRIILLETDSLYRLFSEDLTKQRSQGSLFCVGSRSFVFLTFPLFFNKNRDRTVPCTMSGRPSERAERSTPPFSVSWKFNLKFNFFNVEVVVFFRKIDLDVRRLDGKSSTLKTSTSSWNSTLCRGKSLHLFTSPLEVWVIYGIM